MHNVYVTLYKTKKTHFVKVITKNCCLNNTTRKQFYQIKLQSKLKLPKWTCFRQVKKKKKKENYCFQESQQTIAHEK